MSAEGSQPGAVSPSNRLSVERSGETGRAVFLSYASQDAEAARRICDALRAAGVEVWVDQNELVGGDAWDAKIRRQIKECALFVPVISANTQARREGYFRLEWRLAVERMRQMDDDLPFLVPVVIDETKDADAFVPEKFREVQWTRLRMDETPTQFSGRVRALLGGSALKPGSGRVAPRVEPEDSALGRAPWRAWVAGLALVVAGVVLVWWRPWQAHSPATTTAPTTAGTRVAPRASAAASEAQQKAEAARRHFQGIFTRADLAIAEDLGRRATELESTRALGWAVRAGANACYLMRAFVTGEAAQQRARNAQTFADKALALNRHETEALIALGQVAMYQDAPSQAEAYYRRVLEKEPNNSFAHRYLSIVLRSNKRVPEAIALMQEAARRFPQDTLTHFDLAVAYAHGWDWPRAWEAADASLAITPFPGALMLKVRLAFQWKGDVALMRELIEKLDVTYRGEDDAVVWDMRCALWAQQPERVLEAAGRTTRQYLEESFIFPGPKAWFTAKAHEVAGRKALARQHWQVAEAVLRERLQADPQNLAFRLKLAVTLAAMGERDKAEREIQPIEAAWREQMNPDRAWDLATYYAARDDAQKAVPLLKAALHAGTGIAPLTLHHLRLDPAWKGIRASPEFQALLANPPPLPPPMTPPPAGAGVGARPN